MPMKKILVLLFVASLLLAGCTELTDAVDENGDEVLKIDVDEDIALEKVEDFLTVDESESFGIMVMYEVDMSEMGDDSGMLNVDENSMMLVEMTEAWSPEGYHSSSVMGIDNGDVTISLLTSVTHVGTTMYVSIGYEIEGELGADATEEETEEFEMMVAMMPEVEHFSMTTTTTHTEVIAAMAEESEDDIDDMDPMAFLEMIEMIEEYGTFTPAESVEGLQLFDVAIDMAEIITPVEALDMCDADDSDGISWSEFVSENCDETDSEDMSDLETLFNDADTDTSGELTVDELQAFIDSVTTFYEDDMEEGDMEDDMGMPSIQVAFTSTGDIEYFSMEMDEMGDEPTVMMMYILAEERIEAMFTGLDAGETVALPFSVSDSMDDDDWGDDSDGEEYFMCDDGEMIPMDYVNDGYDDCDGGEDEMDMGEGDVEMFYVCERFIELATYEASSDDFDTMYADSFDSSICGTAVDVDAEADIDATTPTMPTEFVLEECEEMTLETGETVADCEYLTIQVLDNPDTGVQELYGSFEETDSEDCEGDYDATTMTCTEWYGEIIGSDGNTISIQMSFGIFFQCADGSETIDLTWVNDGMDDCADGSDESSYDTNGEDTMDFTCLDGTVVPLDYVLDGEEDCTGGEDEMPYMEMNFWFDYQYDENTGSGLMVFAEEVYDDDETEMVCYDFNTHTVDESIDNQADCEYAGYMWTEDQSDDHGGDDYSDEIVMYVTSDMDFHFEGDMSDYKIELATCEEDYDMDTGEETTTCTTVMSVAIADAGEDSDIMFHDADSSGTLSVGDMIHIGETAEDWDTVRLYSVSADAYSDENPMHDAPGFTGLVGMLALLGAAFIRRNE